MYIQFLFSHIFLGSRVSHVISSLMKEDFFMLLSKILFSREGMSLDSIREVCIFDYLCKKDNNKDEEASDLLQRVDPLFSLG